MIYLTKRGLARLVAFSAALIIALTALVFLSNAEAEDAKRTLEINYMRAKEDLSRSIENIKVTLYKAQYSGSHELLNELAVRLNNDAMAAKACISQLPAPDMNLVNTNKFLSQVGNYSKALSVKEEITAEDRENLKKLYDYAVSLSESLWNANSPPPNITDGFKELEDSFSDYPMLIYDGPFSDHIMQKEPLMLKNARIISLEQALEIAEKASGVSSLTLITEEEGRMPSYVFGRGNTTVAVTKQGGYIVYMLGNRTVSGERITAAQATASAKKYLERLGINEVTETYYETRDGLCIINFAAVQGDVTLYTDLIKVGVAMDTGEVISMDARGWLVNHNPKGRELTEPLLTAEEARAFLSPLLTVASAKLCLIPSDGMNERFCYEFKCSAEDGRQILVYINADTGREEQILLLEISRNGTLTV